MLDKSTVAHLSLMVVLMEDKSVCVCLCTFVCGAPNLPAVSLDRYGRNSGTSAAAPQLLMGMVWRGAKPPELNPPHLTPVCMHTLTWSHSITQLSPCVYTQRCTHWLPLPPVYCQLVLTCTQPSLIHRVRPVTLCHSLCKTVRRAIRTSVQRGEKCNMLNVSRWIT